MVGGSNICKPSQILQRRLGNGGGRGEGLQRHDSSQSRGGEDRLRAGQTGTVCSERNLMLQSSRKKNQMAVATTGRTNGAP